VNGREMRSKATIPANGFLPACVTAYGAQMN